MEFFPKILHRAQKVFFGFDFVNIEFFSEHNRVWLVRIGDYNVGAGVDEIQMCLNHNFWLFDIRDRRP